MAVAFPSTPGMTPPLTVDNYENYSGLLTTILSFAMFLVLGSWSIRAYSAYARHARGIDDGFFAFIALVALGQISAASVSIHLSWGQAAKLISLDDESKRAVYSADILYVTILGVSKASTAVFYRTITMRSSQWIIHGLIVVIVSWGPFLCGANSLTSNRIYNANSEFQFSRWQVITALDVILEMALFLYPIRVIPKLQTSLGKKVVVVFILSCRVMYLVKL
ncbi:hypothetical protein N7451_004766 [Penicillium sp. IBT 35674x]|nr:hypothetical protein N7451_004766 [Penicillium sp. IBT 35674x]